MNNKLEKIAKHKKIHDSWKLPTAEVGFIEELIDDLVEILNESSEPLSYDNILKKVQGKNTNSKNGE